MILSMWAFALPRWFVIGQGCLGRRCDLGQGWYNQCLILCLQLIQSPKKAGGRRPSPRGSQQLWKKLFLPEGGYGQSITTAMAFRK